MAISYKWNGTTYPDEASVRAALSAWAAKSGVSPSYVDEWMARPDVVSRTGTAEAQGSTPTAKLLDTLDNGVSGLNARITQMAPAAQSPVASGTTIGGATYTDGDPWAGVSAGWYRDGTPVADPRILQSQQEALQKAQVDNGAYWAGQGVQFANGSNGTVGFIDPKTGQFSPGVVTSNAKGENMGVMPQSVVASLGLNDLGGSTQGSADAPTSGNFMADYGFLLPLGAAAGAAFAGGGLSGLGGASDAALAAADSAQFGAGLTGSGMATGATIGGSGGGLTNLLASLPNPQQFASAGLNDAPLGGYASAPDLTGFQTPYAAPAATDFGPAAIDTSGLTTGSSLTSPALDAGASGLGGLPSNAVIPMGGSTGLGTSIPSVPTGYPTTGASGTGADSTQIGTGATADAGTVTNAGTGVQVGGGAATAAAAGGTALSRIMSGTATSQDFLDILGKAAPGLISAYGSSQQADAAQSLANDFKAFGAPSRARYEASMTPGFDPTTIPGYKGALDTSSDAILRRLSATGGNPFGNPGGLIEANKAIVSGTALPAIQNYQNQNANTGGLGALASAYPSAAGGALNSNQNVWSDVGSAVGAVTNPQPNLDAILKQLAAKSTAYGLA